MSGRCEICERKPLYGNNSNFSQKRTRRRVFVNKIDAAGLRGFPRGTEGRHGAFERVGQLAV